MKGIAGKTKKGMERFKGYGGEEYGAWYEYLYDFDAGLLYRWEFWCLFGSISWNGIEEVGNSASCM